MIIAFNSFFSLKLDGCRPPWEALQSSRYFRSNKTWGTCPCRWSLIPPSISAMSKFLVCFEASAEISSQGLSIRRSITESGWVSTTQRVGAAAMRKTVMNPKVWTKKVGISGDSWRISDVENGETTTIWVNGVVLGQKNSGLVDNKFDRLCRLSQSWTTMRNLQVDTNIIHEASADIWIQLLQQCCCSFSTRLPQGVFIKKEISPEIWLSHSAVVDDGEVSHTRKYKILEDLTSCWGGTE